MYYAINNRGTRLLLLQYTTEFCISHVQFEFEQSVDDILNHPNHLEPSQPCGVFVRTVDPMIDVPTKMFVSSDGRCGSDAQEVRMRFSSYFLLLSNNHNYL